MDNFIFHGVSYDEEDLNDKIRVLELYGYETKIKKKESFWEIYTKIL